MEKIHTKKFYVLKYSQKRLRTYFQLAFSASGGARAKLYKENIFNAKGDSYLIC
jgi:hypothetical protein